jgi:membrane-bound lytic murein transglycosylase A
VPLTPGRSIAVDRLHDYGTPFFIEANLAIENTNPVSPFHRLMIAQDTGSAIVGPARADCECDWQCERHRRRLRSFGRSRHARSKIMLMASPSSRLIHLV